MWEVCVPAMRATRVRHRCVDGAVLGATAAVLCASPTKTRAREGGREGGDMSRVTLGGVVETGQGPWLLSSHPDPSVLSSLPPATHTHPPAPRRAALFLGLGSRERRTQLSREIC